MTKMKTINLSITFIKNSSLYLNISKKYNTHSGMTPALPIKISKECKSIIKQTPPLKYLKSAEAKLSTLTVWNL